MRWRSKQKADRFLTGPWRELMVNSVALVYKFVETETETRALPCSIFVHTEPETEFCSLLSTQLYVVI